MVINESDTAILVVLITNLVGFATTITTLVFQNIARARERRWDQEDREKTKDRFESHNSVISGAIAENTTISKLALEKANQAYGEANEINLKLATSGVKLITPSKGIKIDTDLT